MPLKTFQLIEDLLAPTKPSAATVTYDSIVQAVQNHVKPERSALVSCYAFDTRVRESHESVGDFVKTLKHLAAKCLFSDDARSDRLRDRLIAGIRNDRMLRSLLNEKLADLTFDKAVQQCLAMEQSAKDVDTLKGTGPPFSSRQAETETDGIH